MSKMHLFTVLLFLLAQAAFPMEKPAIEWVRLYDEWTAIYSVIETADGGLAVTAGKIGLSQYSFYKLDHDGEFQWGAPSGLYYQRGNAVIQLQNGSFVVAGYGKETEESSIALLFAKFDSVGIEIWTNLYNSSYPGAESANSICELPDGGYGICGGIAPAGEMNQAWILRTDSQGDTLWTREWGDIYNDRAAEILYHEGGLLVFMRGRKPGENYGVFLVRYSMSGDLEWEASFPEWPGVYPDAQAMCEASDGGLLLMDNYWPEIFHTDYLGNPDWVIWPPGVDQPYGYSLSTTMDGGILYGGEIRGEPDSKSICGVIARFDSSGNDLWYDNIYEQTCQAIYSATQLSQGGYVACGRAIVSGSYKGFLIKYAPELGIEEGEPASALRMDVSPNPCSSLLSVSFNLPEAGNASVRIFDLSGRLVSTVTDGQFQAGANSVEWAVPDGVSSGCYFVQYNSEMGSRTESVALIK